MPIPATTSSDVFLRKLLDRQADNFDEWIDVKDFIKTLPILDPHAAADEGSEVPWSVQRDIEYLQHHRLLFFRPENPHIRLTALGVYTALIFDLPPDAPPREA
jgi:hypothetical protein